MKNTNGTMSPSPPCFAEALREGKRGQGGGKLMAFTLVEVLVAMAISSIAVSSAYFCLGIITRQFRDYKTSTDKTSELFLIKSLLQYDIHSFPYLKNLSDHEIEVSGNTDKKVEYEFRQLYALRKQNLVVDTFHIKTAELKLLFEKEQRPQPHSLIDEVALRVELPDSVYSMRFFKEYAPDVLMQQEETQNNP